MRVTFVALFLMLALSVTSTTEPSHPNCKFNNFLLDYVRSQGVEINAEPTFFYQGCQDEWKVHGGCCKREPLFKLAQSDYNKVYPILKSGYRQVGNMDKFTQWYRATVRAGIDKINDKIPLQLSVSKADRSAARDEIKYIKDSYLAEMKRVGEWITNNAVDTIKSQHVCMETIAHLRTSSLCYACSGRASMFFSDGRLNMHENECRATIKKCSDSWTKILDYISQVDKFYKIINSLKQLLDINYNDALFQNPSKVIMDWSTQINLAADLAQCKEGVCTFEKIRTICDSMISYEQPYYLEQVFNMIGKEIEPALNNNKEVVTQVSNNAIKYFDSLDINKIIEKLLTIRKTRLAGKSGRKLLLLTKASALLSKVTTTIPQATSLWQSPLQPALAAATSTVQPLQEFPTVNPLLCFGASVCISEKVILSVDRCSLNCLMCTSESTSFP